MRNITPKLGSVVVFCRNHTESLYCLTTQRRFIQPHKVVTLSTDKMKRRAFRLRAVIDSAKNKRARQEAITEYVNLISQMNRHN